MRHDIPVGALGSPGKAMASAVAACVHCGFCLPTCPTYRVLGEEMDSPRGRIVLMKEALEGHVALVSALPYLDRCLGCLACVTACPSGVDYSGLITAFRGHAEDERRRPPVERAYRAAVLGTLLHPERAAPLAQLGVLARSVVPGRVVERLPDRVRRPLELLPRRVRQVRRPGPLPELVPARGTRRARVALLAGCVQQVLDQQINWATLRVLSRNGVEVVIPRGQCCCGALAMHTGDQARARALARRNLAAFGASGASARPDPAPAAPAASVGPSASASSALPTADLSDVDGEGVPRPSADLSDVDGEGPPRVPAGFAGVDAVLANAAGCGAGMRDYGLLFAGEPEEERALALAAQVRDVSEFLDALGLAVEPPPLPEPLAVAYHDACHLAHAQGVREQPRRLLRSIPNLTLAEPIEWELCCGSAGTYNLEQPAIAEELGLRKAANLEATGAQAVVAGNIGCLTQIGRYSGLPAFHTMQLLDAAYCGRSLGRGGRAR